MKYRDQLLTISNEELKSEVEFKAMGNELDKSVEGDNGLIIAKILYAKKYLDTKLCTELRKKNVKAAKLLINAGVDVCTDFHSPIKIAIEIGSKEIVELILRKYDSYELLKLIEKETNLLALAAKYNQIKILKVLIKIDGVKRIRGVLDEAIESATEVGNIEIVKYLIKEGGYITDKAIILSVEKGFTKIFELFFKDKEKYIANRIYDIRKDYYTIESSTLLEIAAKNGHVDIVQLLVNKMEKYKLNILYTKLRKTIPGGVRDIITESISRKSVIEMAIDYATANGHSEIVEILEKIKK